MNLIQIDIIGLKASQALLEFEEDSLAREAAAIRLVAHDALNFGRKDNGLTSGVGLEEFADNALAIAAGVDIGCVPEVDSEVEGLTEKGLALLLVESPQVTAGFGFVRGRGTAVGHAAEADAGDFHAGGAEIDVFHVVLLGGMGSGKQFRFVLV